MEKINSELNTAQQAAVEQIDGSILILAGAGSGKTKTITSRVAYLINNGIPPSSILTLTFTNKAASEMRSRALSLLDEEVSYLPLLCTFHKFGLLFLKFHMQRLGRPNSFVIIDTDDKKRIIKSFDTDLPISLIASEISRFKNNLITPDDAQKTAELPNYKKIANLYQKYESYLAQNNLVDFDDLLALPYKILEQDAMLCKETSLRYQYIMVDEYQDTNDLQFKLLQKLSSEHQNLCVVGDDDQSIYGWRGANIKNILEFKDIFENTTVIKLTKNYRSTHTILKAANELIEHNRNRLGKELIGTKEEGKEITSLHHDDEVMEARSISSKVKTLINEGVDPREIAILYRINALSRSIEEGLNRATVPYKMVGGLKFYERAEIKDLISYLRIIANPHDDFSIKRIINKPKRGLGKATLDKILFAADERKISIFEFLTTHQESLQVAVSKKAFSTLEKFCQDILDLQASTKESTYALIDNLEDTFGIRAYYETLPDALDRVSNIDEFYGLFRDFVIQNPDALLDDFLNDIALQSDQDQIDERCISIMSVHASKGLEFEHLFVIGLEEGFFPLIGDGTDLEEERRLGYVAITRAKQELTLSSSASRYYKGKRAGLTKSRFLAECGVNKGSLKLDRTTSYKKGALVKHKIFGIGRVIEVSKVKREYKLKINFGGTKRDILASFVEKI
ncbi:MAG: UvrD-helicase domain-containing protein [Epsilonproteobacteria bacterium]|nr:UvrD-helicase domain-containing protein [Campylobacterota bacterium]